MYEKYKWGRLTMAWIRREQYVVVKAGTALEDEMYACMERDLIRASIHDDTLIW